MRFGAKAVAGWPGAFADEGVTEGVVFAAGDGGGGGLLRPGDDVAVAVVRGIVIYDLRIYDFRLG